MPLLRRSPSTPAGGTANARAARDRQRAASLPTWPGESPAGVLGGIVRTCANPRCSYGWFRPWRSRSAPFFEAGWCCSQACTASQIEAAIRREMDAPARAREAHRHRIPLGLAMLEQGWITQKVLRAALESQRAAGCGRLGHWLVRLQAASEEQVTRALGLQWGCPVLEIEPYRPEDLTALLPRLLVDAYGALPLRVAAGKILYLGFEDRIDPALALGIERMTGLRVEGGLVKESHFRPAHARLLEARFPHLELIEAASESALAAALVRSVEKARPVESRLVRVHDCLWLRQWLRPQGGPVPQPGSIRDVIASAGAH
jgi:Type II secretion system (T2SS), protein E, N-terminal domain